MRVVLFATILTISQAHQAGAAQEPALAKTPELKKLHALLAIDTGSLGLTKSVLRDRNNMRWLLTCHVPEERISVTILEGKQVNREDILKYYHHLKVGADEGLLFFYAGHGTIDKDKGHCLQPQDGKVPLVPRNDIRQAMQEKKPGLVLLLTDCCSTRPDGDPSTEINLKGGTGHIKLHPVLKCLLFQHRGLVDITAAQDGMGSYGDAINGGIFTQAMCRLLLTDLKTLDKSKNGFLTWKEYFTILTRKTEDTFSKWADTYRAKGITIDDKFQRPRSFTLPESPSTAVFKENNSVYAVVCINNATGKSLKYSYRWSGEKDWKDMELAKDGKFCHERKLRAGESLPRLEFKGVTEDGSGMLEPKKWTGTGKPTTRDGIEYKITSNK